MNEKHIDKNIEVVEVSNDSHQDRSNSREKREQWEHTLFKIGHDIYDKYNLIIFYPAFSYRLDNAVDNAANTRETSENYNGEIISAEQRAPEIYCAEIASTRDIFFFLIEIHKRCALHFEKTSFEDQAEQAVFRQFKRERNIKFAMTIRNNAFPE